MNRQRPLTLRITANWPTYFVPRLTIVLTITVPFGYLDPTLRLLAYTFFTPACALDRGPVLVKGFLLMRGHFCQPFVYAGRPLAFVRADATTTTDDARAATATIARSFARTPGSCLVRTAVRTPRGKTTINS